VQTAPTVVSFIKMKSQKPSIKKCSRKMVKCLKGGWARKSVIL